MPLLSRRDLPSMSLLCAFEAAARLHSFTAAATELHLTQSAVSRQIRALEAQLGTALFVRERQTVRLNPAGQAYAQAVRAALQQIAAAGQGLGADTRAGALRLAVLPTFGTRWLAPRLPQFCAQHPEITVHLSTQLAPFDFQHTPVDAAIHFGQAHWPGGELLDLMGETVLPACSPALRAQHGFAHPQDLLAAPLLHLTSRPQAWQRWLARHQVTQPPGPGMHFDQFATAAQAAMAGVGMALLPHFLIAQELEQGALVCALPELPDLPAQDSTGRYHLVWPIGHGDHPPLLAFRRWLQQAVRDFEAQ